MTIIVFYKVGNDLGWERDRFDIESDVDAFRLIYNNRVELGAHFYDVESFYGDDAYGFDQIMPNGSDLETGFNDELFDGGYWMKVLHLPSDDVREVLGLE